MSYHSTAAFARNFTKLSLMTNAIKRELVTPVKVRCVLDSGFPYDAFNARAVVTPHSAFRVVNWVSVTSFWGSSETVPYLDIDKLKNNLVFVASADLKMEPQLYDLDAEKRPITLVTELVYAGTSSFKNRNDLYLPGYTKPLVTMHIHYVLIDGEKRRPHPAPNWWRDKFVPHVKPGATPLKMPEVALPDKSRIIDMEYLVGPGDVDPYCHVSSANFIKVCTDSYIMWHIKTHGYVNNGDPFRIMKHMVQSFKGEAAVGDVINVQFWPSEENENVFTFVLTNKDKVMSETIIEFYPLVKDTKSQL